MQEWIIAMRVVSILLILRDMAKTVFSGKTKEKEEMLPLCESHPQKEKVERYAASFRKLADTFYGMPYRKEFLSGGQLNRIISDTSAAVCSRCYQREICWGERAGETMRGSENMIRTMEEGNEESIQRARSECRPIDIARLCTAQAERVPGVLRAHSTVTPKHITVSVNGDTSTAEDLTNRVTQQLTPHLANVAGAPTLTVHVKEPEGVTE